MAELPEFPGAFHVPDERDVWSDEIGLFAAGDIEEKIMLDMGEFEPQGAAPFCVSFSVTKMVEYQLEDREFCIPHLFYHSGGSFYGSYFRSNLNTAQHRGLLPESVKPMSEVDIWRFDREEFDGLKQEMEAIDFTNEYKIPGYVRVPARDRDIKLALQEGCPLMVGLSASGDYWDEDFKNDPARVNHAAPLVGLDSSHYYIFDSLKPSGDFDGYHAISRESEFSVIYALVDIPPGDLKKKRDEARKGNEGRYGMERNFQKEIDAAYRLKNAALTFLPYQIYEHMGQNWEMYIRAAVYGGYTITKTTRVWGWPRKGPGDILRDAEVFFLTGQHLFDFNQPK